MTTSENTVDGIWDDWRTSVNLTASELEEWLGTDESKSVGQSEGGEAVGHRSGRRIVTILRTRKDDLTGADVQHMHKVVGYIHRHLAQKPSSAVPDSPWRYSLMNWGHDPLKS